MASSSLSSVVSDLVRASMGSSVSGTVTDDDLDRHIGEIILREAKQKAEQYKRDGYRAYLPATDANVPRTNKRFLSSIIRNTDDHNKAILRSQAVAAAELKEEREEQERRERRARADEAAQDRLRRLMSGGRRSVGEDRWRPDRDRDRSRREGKKRERNWEHDGNDAEELSRSRSRDKKRYWDEDEDEFQSRVGASHPSHRDSDSHGDRRHHRRGRRRSSSRSCSPRRDKAASKHRSRSRSRSHTRTKSDESSSHSRHRCHRSSSRSGTLVKGRTRSRRSRSPTHTKTSNGDSSHSHRRHRHRSTSRSRSPRRDKAKLSQSPPRPNISDGRPERRTSIRSPSVHLDKPQTKPASKSPSPAPLAAESGHVPAPPSRTSSPPPMVSKMDKYFSPTYDPRLDVAPLASSSSLTIDVPATGLVDNAQFEGWDAMLELIRIRREDREEKKRLERMGLLPEKGKEGRGKKGQGMVSAAAEDGKGIMEIEYKKKGAVREWDMGKEGF